MADERLETFGFEGDEASDITRERWLQAQRDLVTTTLDYNLQTIASLVSEETIDLSPTFQRRERWDMVRKSRLIESFMMNVPMPPVFLNEDDYGTYSVIDGKQRLTAVSEFMAGKFALTGLTVFEEANGARFSDLDLALQSVLQTRASLRAIIILRMSDPLIKYHVFQRLNTGGVRLNAQEVRNVVFDGGLNDLIVSLSESTEFHKLLRIDAKNPGASALWREMRDVELVLRYLTLRGSLMRYKGSLGGAMNAFMRDNQDVSEEKLRSYRNDFNATVHLVALAFGDTAFRRWSPKTQRYGRQTLATLFDAQMLACRGLNKADLESNTKEIQRAMRDLFYDDEFTRSIGSATNTPAFVRYRVGRVSSLVRSLVD